MQAPSCASVRIFWLDREKTLEELRLIARRLRADHPEIERVLLFGSLARRDAAPGSDADLLLILSSGDGAFWERIPRYLPEGASLGVEVFPYTRAEIAAMLDNGNAFIRQALAEGIVLEG